MGALSGSLHGGANAEVMKMLLELESGKDIKGWVKSRPAPMSPSKKGDKGRPVIPLILSLPHSSGFSLLQGNCFAIMGVNLEGIPKLHMEDRANDANGPNHLKRHLLLQSADQRRGDWSLFEVSVLRMPLRVR